MKYLITISLCFLSSTILAQKKLNYKLAVKYSFVGQLDSTDVKTKINAENFLLFVGDSTSLFISENRIGLDTMIAKGNLADMGRLMQMPQPSMNMRIVKSKNTIHIFDEISSNSFVYEDSVKLDWKIGTDTLRIGSLLATKATTKFRGRNYIAWFCSDIPIANGPYKFSGLPGLILAIADDKNQYSFSLNKLEVLELPRSIPFDYQSKAKSVSKLVFTKSAKEYKNNPIPQMESEGAVFSEETKRLILQKYKERNTGPKNPIELTVN